MNATVGLGPFRLERPLAEGGAGEVWLGRHEATGHAVAVKVVAPGKGKVHRILWTFRTEVHAAAGLDHPAIVPVFDFGQVSFEAARASNDRLVEGSPYLVTPFIGGGTLRPMLGHLDWPRLRWVLETLLDALAHAHARGVIHRDIKPENVLVTEDRRHVLLTDFGIAHALTKDREGDDQRWVAGTPAYMAPEQLHASWRDHGPWTDLYAFGCMTWALACGKPPFGARTLEQIAEARLHLSTREFVPAHPLPSAFAEWLAGLVALDPDRRFRHAADAAAALARITESEASGPLTAPPERPALPERVRRDRSAPTPGPATDDPATDDSAAADPDAATEAMTAAETGATHTVSIVAKAPPDAVPTTAPGVAPPGRLGARPGVPSSWRGESSVEAAEPLPATGQGVFGLRRIPLIARESERDRLWSALHAAGEGGGPRALILRGPAGVGKTRLASWLAERAHETGAANVLRAVHGPTLEAGQGLGPMLARYLRCEGLSRLWVEARLGRLGNADHLPAREAIGEIVCPSGPADRELTARRVHFQSAVQRFEVIRGLLSHLAAERALVLMLDDVQWGLDALGLTAHLLDGELPIPLLVVMTVRDEALAEQPEAREALDQILESPRCDTVAIGPLARPDHEALVRRMVGLDEEIAALVAARTAGNPLFAEHLVDDWIGRGLLVGSERGYRLKDGGEVPLPESLHAVWSARIERVLADRPATAGTALELAAVLGTSVAVTEWQSACREAGVDAPIELLAQLAGERLVAPGSLGLAQGFAFIHEMLRESLALRARAAGRLEAHHRACAGILDGEGDPVIAERLALHRLAAGDAEEALEPLLTALEHAVYLGDGRHARRLLSTAKDAIASLPANPYDVRQARLRVIHSQVAWIGGDQEAAQVWVDEAAKMVEAAGVGAATAPEWLRIEGFVRWQQASLDVTLGRFEEAGPKLEAALEAAEAVGDAEVVARRKLQVGMWHQQRGNLAEAERWMREGQATFERQGEATGLGIALLHRGQIAYLGGRPDEARSLCGRALEPLEAAGASDHAGQCYVLRGEIERAAGNLEAAEKAYRDALRLYQPLGHHRAALVNVNLGLVQIERGAFAEARETLETAWREIEKANIRLLFGTLHLCMLPCLAHAGDGTAFDARIEAARSELAESQYAEPDHGRLGALAGDLAAGRGWTDRARAAYALAIDEWRKLGREEEARAVDGRLQGLDAGD